MSYEFEESDGYKRALKDGLEAVDKNADLDPPYYEKRIWNAAIEAAAERAVYNDVKVNQDQIRKLRK